MEAKQGGLWQGQKKPRFGALLGHYIKDCACLNSWKNMNANSSKLRSAMPAFLHAGSKYMSWTILITYQNERAHVYSYRKLLLLREFGRFLVDFRGIYNWTGTLVTLMTHSHSCKCTCFCTRAQRTLHEQRALGGSSCSSWYGLFL